MPFLYFVLLRDAMSFRAYLVDFDGTLYHAKPVQLCMALELVLCGIGAIRTLRRFRKSHEQLRRGLLPEAILATRSSPFEQQLAFTASELNLPEGRRSTDRRTMDDGASSQMDPALLAAQSDP